LTLARAATHYLNTHVWKWFSTSWIVSVLDGAAIRSQWPVNRYMSLTTGLVPFDSHSVKQLGEVEYAAELLTYRFSELDLRKAAIRLCEQPQYHTFAIVEMLDTVCRQRWLHCHPPSGTIETLFATQGDQGEWFAVLGAKTNPKMIGWWSPAGGTFLTMVRRTEHGMNP